MKITTEQILQMTDDEIIAMITFGRSILQERFQVKKQSLESDYARTLRALDARPKKARKPESQKARKRGANAVSQAA